jgi:tetratricopeptide (TPR) repeat protein
LELEPDCDYTCKKYGDTLFELGRQFEVGRYEEALSSYDRALELEPDCDYTWRKHGNTLFELGRHEEALSILQTAKEWTLRID